MSVIDRRSRGLCVLIRGTSGGSRSNLLWPASRMGTSLSPARHEPPSASQKRETRMMELFLGSWTYRSLLNDPDLGTDFDALEFGRATLSIVETGPAEIGGTIGGSGWSLALHGGVGFGSPMQARFQGSGTVDGAPWVYDYV